MGISKTSEVDAYKVAEVVEKMSIHQLKTTLCFISGHLEDKTTTEETINYLQELIFELHERKDNIEVI
mgnify:CR=1 FL=1